MLTLKTIKKTEHREKCQIKDASLISFHFGVFLNIAPFVCSQKCNVVGALDHSIK